MTEARDAAVSFENVVKRFGTVHALDDVSFAIANGEFFSLLGPSGSGKTTSLRLVAGFERPDAGCVRLAGKDIADTPPHARDVNTVFQDYALFPHMSVLDNVSYGLRMRGAAARVAEPRARTMLELVQLGAFEQRHPDSLSGGQRQRVALARALANGPRVLLLDEPLAALDLGLREQMQTELKELHRRLGITFVLVTHDQGEALSMSDRVAVFNAGRLEQIATPRDLYLRPQTEFVARFVGTANILKGSFAKALLGHDGCYALRAEKIGIRSADSALRAAEVRCRGTVADVQYHGASSRIRVAVGGGQVLMVQRVEGGNDGLGEPGATVELHWAETAMCPVRETPA